MNDTDLDRELQQRMAWYLWTENHVRYSLRERVSLWLDEPWHHDIAVLVLVFGLLALIYIGGGKVAV